MLQCTDFCSLLKYRSLLRRIWYPFFGTLDLFGTRTYLPPYELSAFYNVCSIYVRVLTRRAFHIFPSPTLSDAVSSYQVVSANARTGLPQLTWTFLLSVIRPTPAGHLTKKIRRTLFVKLRPKGVFLCYLFLFYRSFTPYILRSTGPIGRGKGRTPARSKDLLPAVTIM